VRRKRRKRREQMKQTEARWQQRHVGSKGTLAAEARWQQKHVKGRIDRADRGTLVVKQAEQNWQTD
jgi:hypothetical protein